MLRIVLTLLTVCMLRAEVASAGLVKASNWDLSLLWNVPAGTTADVAITGSTAMFAIGNAVKGVEVNTLFTPNPTARTALFSRLAEAIAIHDDYFVTAESGGLTHWYEFTDATTWERKATLDVGLFNISRLHAEANYALATDGFETKVIDKSDLTAPRVVSTTDGGLNFAVSDNFLLTATGSSLLVDDMTKFDEPARVDELIWSVNDVAFISNDMIATIGENDYSTWQFTPMIVGPFGTNPNFSSGRFIAVTSTDVGYTIENPNNILVKRINQQDASMPTVEKEFTINEVFLPPVSLNARGNIAYPSIPTGTFRIDFTATPALTGEAYRNGDNRHLLVDPRSTGMTGMVIGIGTDYGAVLATISWATGNLQREGVFRGPDFRTAVLTLRLDFKTSGSQMENWYLVIAGGRGGVYITDITDPGDPTLVRQRGTGGLVVDVEILDDIAYVLSGFTGSAELEVWDISDIGNPLMLDEIDIAGFAAHQLEVEGDRLYATTGDFHVFDITVADAPVYMGGLGANDVRTVDARGTTAYVGRRSGQVQVLDVSNPGDMIDLGSTETFAFLEDIDVIRAEDIPSKTEGKQEQLLAIVSGGDSGVVLLDVTDPQNIQEQSRFDTADVAFSSVVLGNLVGVADGFSGYYALELTGVVPALLQNLQVRATDEGAVVFWEVFDDGKIDGFRVLRSTGNSTPVLVGDAKALPPEARQILDADVEPATSYEYQLSILRDGEEILSKSVALKTPSLLTRVDPNYPNPFNPSTTIAFSLADEERVSLDIYNLRGERVTTLVADEVRPSGRYEVVWDGRDDRGHSVASGVYEYRLVIGGRAHTHKMTLIK